MFRKLIHAFAALALLTAPTAGFAQTISTSPAPDVRVLAASAVAQSITGTLTETTLASGTIPAGTLGANGQVDIVALWSHTNSANNKTLRVKFGGTNFMAVVTTTTGVDQTYTRIANRGVTNSQIGFIAASSTGFSAIAGSNVTASVDTTADVTLLITGQLALGSETITLESYIVKLVKA